MSNYPESTYECPWRGHSRTAPHSCFRIHIGLGREAHTRRCSTKISNVYRRFRWMCNAITAPLDKKYCPICSGLVRSPGGLLPYSGKRGECRKSPSLKVSGLQGVGGAVPPSQHNSRRTCVVPPHIAYVCVGGLGLPKNGYCPKTENIPYSSRFEAPIPPIFAAICMTNQKAGINKYSKISIHVTTRREKSGMHDAIWVRKGRVVGAACGRVAPSHWPCCIFMRWVWGGPHRLPDTTHALPPHLRITLRNPQGQQAGSGWVQIRGTHPTCTTTETSDPLRVCATTSSPKPGGRCCTARTQTQTQICTSAVIYGILP